MKKHLTLASIVRNEDGSVTFDFEKPVRCDRCKHWGDVSGLRIPEPHARDGKHTCRIINDGNGQIADVADGDGTYFVFWTAAEFGCVLYEPKDPP